MIIQPLCLLVRTFERHRIELTQNPLILGQPSSPPRTFYRTKLLGLKASLLACRVDEFLHLLSGPGQQLTKKLEPKLQFFSAVAPLKLDGVQFQLSNTEKRTQMCRSQSLTLENEHNKTKACIINLETSA